MADRNAPAVLYLVDITPHCVHEGAVVEPLHLAIGRRCEPCEPGASRRQHGEACSRNSSPGPENLEDSPETREEIIDRRRGGNLSRLGGQRDAFHRLGELVRHHQDELITARGKGPRKPRD